MPSSILIAALGGVKHIVFERRWRELAGLWRAYGIGRRARPLLGVYWERHWDEPLTAIRARYGVVPISPAPS